jgi:hypothetical protein
MFPPLEVPNKLVKLFAIEKRSDLKNYCSDLMITSEEFVGAILLCPKIGYDHFSRHEEYQPEDAQLTRRDVEVLRTTDPVIRAQGIRTFTNKIRNLFAVRKHVSAHLFESRSRWHLFYFTFSDAEEVSNNHWMSGPHVHFVNDLWPKYCPELLDDLLFSGRKIKIYDSIHIRFVRQN